MPFVNLINQEKKTDIKTEARESWQKMLSDVWLVFVQCCLIVSNGTKIYIILITWCVMLWKTIALYCTPFGLKTARTTNYTGSNYIMMALLALRKTTELQKRYRQLCTAPLAVQTGFESNNLDEELKENIFNKTLVCRQIITNRSMKFDCFFFGPCTSSYIVRNDVSNQCSHICIQFVALLLPLQIRAEKRWPIVTRLSAPTTIIFGKINAELTSPAHTFASKGFIHVCNDALLLTPYFVCQWGTVLQMPQSYFIHWWDKVPRSTQQASL